MPVSEDAVDEVAQLVALAALTYYPGIAVDESGYDLDDTITCCLEPIEEAAAGETLERLRAAVGDAIVDPSAHRERLVDALLALLVPAPV